MSAGYQTPGVFYETVDASAATITGVRTDIAGFVGIAERGAVDVPVPVESWRQFQARFGGFTGAGYLAYAVRGFFENGGRRCWVVRVASRDPLTGAHAAVGMARSSTAADVWRVEASSAGAWGNTLKVRLAMTHRAQTTTDLARSEPEYTTVTDTSGFTRGTLVRISQHAMGPVLYKVVSDVDPVRRRLLWVQDRPERRLPYDAPLTGLDMSAPARVESVEYSLVVSERGIPVEVYDGISVIPEHPQYGPTRFAPVAPPTDIDAERGVPMPPARVVLVEQRVDYGADPVTPRPSRITVSIGDLPETVDLTLAGGTDGLAQLRPYDFTGEDEAVGDSDEVKRAKRRGVRALGAISEVAIVAVPDIHIQPEAPPLVAPLPPYVPDPCLPPPQVPPLASAPVLVTELPPIFSEDEIYRVQADLVQHCADRRDRFAILDAPYAAADTPALGISAIQAWRTRFDTSFAALYHSWLRVVDPLRGPGQLTRAIPPSGHVAGLYAKTDVTVGVHKAPANVPLGWVQDVTASLTPAEHGVLNQNGVNGIRTLAGRGVRVMGARTLSSDIRWRFVNVRRVVLMIMKAVDLATQWAVFEPNDDMTRAKLRLALTSYLATLWQQGALAGATLEQAFFVKCDVENNTPDDTANGRLVIDVGVAPAYPFEFIVLRVWRAGNELEFAESSVLGGAH